VEDLLDTEDSFVVIARGGTVSKLIEYVCKRDTLQNLINYAVLFPRNPDSHDEAHRFPYYASDVLSSNTHVL